MWKLIAYIEHKLDNKTDENLEKTQIKGITELSNILTVGSTVSTTAAVTWVF